jgi:hypothetical protein
VEKTKLATFELSRGQAAIQAIQSGQWKITEPIPVK